MVLFSWELLWEKGNTGDVSIIYRPQPTYCTGTSNWQETHCLSEALCFIWQLISKFLLLLVLDSWSCMFDAWMKAKTWHICSDVLCLFLINLILHCIANLLFLYFHIHCCMIFGSPLQMLYFSWIQKRIN